MKTNIPTKTINVITMGCSKNLVDSEKLMGQLKQNNLKVSHESNTESDYVIINTCGFIKDAKEESIETILNYIEAKKAGLIKKVFIMGCLSERYLDDLKEDLIDADGIYGVHDMEAIIKDIGADYKKELIGERMLSTPKHYAYLKISEGCDRTCSFCAIPLIRGKNISLPIEELVIEAKKLRDQGVKEIMLIAQDLTYYGVDLYGKKMLGKLLEKLSNIDGLEWIRLHYTYPTQFPDDVLQLMKEKSNICHYMDIPLQHISDRILTSMKRGHKGSTTRKLLKKFREFMPDINIRTTMIVGYPGETEEEFQELLDFVKESRFDRLGAFTYSPEEDTPAFVIEDNISEDEKMDRLNRLMELQEEISFEKNEEKIGRTLKVIIDRKEGAEYYGRTEYDSPEVDNEVIIETNNKLIVGDFYKVKITGAEAFDLRGEIIS
ncbi:MAG: 30S ribosomal protein S12 methylthiotransferase RimO [Bacteroidetes bacterium]|nr:MAG: 30S ribosomal protein S12 methylthiotransferase RimO [Bacteroidota bacterium]